MIHKISSIPNQWFVFNKQQLGYYRVNYDISNWNALIVTLNSGNFNEIHVLNRAQLIDDSLSFAFSGYLDYEKALEVLEHLSRETDYIPWKAAVSHLDELEYLLVGQPIYESFKTFVRLLARRIYVTLGMEEKSGDTLMEKFARELAIDWTCRMGDALQKLLPVLKNQSTNGKEFQHRWKFLSSATA